MSKKVLVLFAVWGVLWGLLSWAFRELFKDALFGWVTEQFKNELNVRQTEVAATMTTYAAPLVVAAVVVGVVAFIAYQSGRKSRKGSAPPGATTQTQSGRMELRYLSDEDTELGTAIYLMATFSAWAKWFAAQHLATNEHKPISEISMLTTASSLVLDTAMNGKLSMRGRSANSINYEPIARETWRLIGIKMESHPASLWRAVIIPRSEVDPERVRQILDYDSIILSSREFEQLWPNEDKRIDRARMKELKKAKRLGADREAIEKLTLGNMAI